MSKQTFFILVGVLVLGLAVFLRFAGRNAKAEDHADSSLPPAAVALVKRTGIASSLALSGAFRPYQQVDVHAKVAGFIRQIFVDVGDHVKSGQVLAVLEVPELNAQVAGAKADIRRYQDAIRRSQSEIQRAESTHTAYHAAYARLKQASESRPGLIAEQELDDSLAKDKETEAQIESARATLAESESQLAVAQADLDRLAALEAYSHITAPFAGVVTKRYADTGALIQAGTASETQSMPVVQLAEWSRLRLVVPVPESAVSELRIGSTVKVHVSAMNRDFDGKIARFADALDEETRTMHTEIDVENPDGVLKDGMYAEARIILTQHNDALTVPIQALDRNPAGATVLVVDAQGRVEQRQLQLGVEGSNRVEVVSGLAEGDRVIIGNRSTFHSGEKVSPKIVNDNSLETEGS
ncbi:MAG TPA: efflux RND transporter periplasmic adaptor subunit [Candidatus Dormibacteraeota bacterium]|nr:efflux RND transporter periplasmic adaptor subunit [Candidatus Dormibacteraeota bacterium]